MCLLIELESRSTYVHYKKFGKFGKIRYGKNTFVNRASELYNKHALDCAHVCQLLVLELK